MKSYSIFSLMLLAFWPFLNLTRQAAAPTDHSDTAYLMPPPGGCDTLFCGMGVVTCYGEINDPTAPVAAVIDMRYNSQAPIGDDWGNPSSGTAVPKIMPITWTVGEMGQVFGTAIDVVGNVYLAASDVYSFMAWPGAFPGSAGPAGTAGIYKADVNCLESTDQLVTTLNVDNQNTVGASVIPNTGGLGNGIGNVVYDPQGKFLYATNLEDGRIYRIDPTSGIILSIYDPFTVDTPGSPGMVTSAERLWGIGVYFDPNTNTNRLYFNRDGAHDASISSEIWSVQLDPSGEFMANPLGGGLFGDNSTTPKLEIPDVDGYQDAVTDIAFSREGHMLLAERGDFHGSQVSLYELIGGVWTFQYQYFIGESFNGLSSAGGIDFTNKEINGDLGYGCDSLIWASGNYLMADQVSDVIYGIQGIPFTGNALANNSQTDLFVDFDGLYGNLSNKGGIGDVEVFRCDCTSDQNFPCGELEFTVNDIGGDMCCYSLDLNSMLPSGGFPIAFVEIKMLSPDWIFNTGSLSVGSGYNWHSIPSNTVIQVGHNSGQIPSGNGNQLDVLEFCISPTGANPTSPQVLGIKWYALGPNGEEYAVCRETFVTECNIDNPDACVSIVDYEVDCSPDSPYEYVFNFKVVNNTGQPVHTVYFQDITPGFGFSSCSASNYLTALALPTSPNPLASGATSNVMCVKFVSSSPILSPTLIDFKLGLVSDDYCCHAADEITILLEPCCDPCEDKAIIVNDLDAQDGACCYSLDIVNDCSLDFFTKIETEILTPGVLYGYHGLGGPQASNWGVYPGSNPRSIVWVPNGGTVPSGTTPDIIQFCLDDINDPSEVPQQVLIKWFTEGCLCSDSLVCVDTLTFQCDAEYACLEISDRDLVCDAENQKYVYEFTVTNTSSIPFTATDLFVQVAAPSDVIITPSGGLFNLNPPLASGQSQTITTCLESTAGFPAPSDFAVLTYRLAFFNGPSADTCCFENRVDTLYFPPCGEEADCGQLSIPNISSDSCCFSLDIENQYARYIGGIQIESLTPGVDFGSHFPGGPSAANWKSTLVNAQLLEWRQQNNGQVPYGLFTNLINFCFDQTSIPAPPYQMEVRWLNGRGEVVCKEILELDCDMQSDDLCGSGPVVIHNGLTPNGDGFNDEFVIDGIDRCEAVNLTIYNRWGNIVYEQASYEDGPNWNGLGVNNNPLPDGTYFYILDFTELNVQRNGYLDIRN
ncbi:MAG: gliding motility-associated C-terminal domain-containing protein [Saprospiraceae bacterium]|nr:gliding motility-associated C-terminal domain-containing protein [Saprospiraceae bacterium]